jgi:hypothetical protein
MTAVTDIVKVSGKKVSLYLYDKDDRDGDPIGMIVQIDGFFYDRPQVKILIKMFNGEEIKISPDTIEKLFHLKNG